MSSLDIALALSRMKIDQWKSRDELESMQEDKLRALLSYASENVPRYRRTLGDKAVRDLEDLSSLPLVTKDEMRSEPDSFISIRHRKDSLHRLMTAGSTGVPMEVFHHPSESGFGPAFELHQFTEAGIGLFDKLAFITYEGEKRRFLQNLGVFRRHHLPMSAEPRDNLAALKRLGPRALLSIPANSVPLAHENTRSGLNLSIEKVFSFAEALSGNARELITSSFGCELYDMYGSIETSWIAWTCEKGSMHLCSDSLIAEIVDDDGNPVKEGEYGNIVLTPLWRRAMPFIRYDLGDRAAFGPRCSCGRGLHTLKSVEGRKAYMVVMPSGKVAPAVYAVIYVRKLPGILLFQMVQERPGELRLKAVPSDRPPSPAAQEKLLKTLRGCFPEPMDIKIEMVEELERGRRGKIPYFISKMDPEVASA